MQSLALLVSCERLHAAEKYVLRTFYLQSNTVCSNTQEVVTGLPRRLCRSRRKKRAGHDSMVGETNSSDFQPLSLAHNGSKVPFKKRIQIRRERTGGSRTNGPAVTQIYPLQGCPVPPRRQQEFKGCTTLAATHWGPWPLCRPHDRVPFRGHLYDRGVPRLSPLRLISSQVARLRSRGEGSAEFLSPSFA